MGLGNCVLLVCGFVCMYACLCLFACRVCRVLLCDCVCLRVCGIVGLLVFVHWCVCFGFVCCWLVLRDGREKVTSQDA